MAPLVGSSCFVPATIPRQPTTNGMTTRRREEAEEQAVEPPWSRESSRRPRAPRKKPSGGGRRTTQRRRTHLPQTRCRDARVRIPCAPLAGGLLRGRSVDFPAALPERVLDGA
ncbi:hypothetical protein QYE76_065650 [Lolium multiflorum]|uniref:Uncharacterized protein n=1 Tax=Lolium multiflorum TaxID=4521 RepID=A0AAD8S9M7_LOLMU|nr:hypothetical protein QYE76_065650 [Lolium multiflorum]